MYTWLVLPSERKAKILELLKERREVSVQGLSELLEVPTANVRRDLRELEGENRISRRHGRAIYRPTLVPAPVEPEADLEESLLDELVAETVTLLDEARNVFLTGGPVLLRVAKKLTGKTIATHDLTLAMAAAAGDNDVTLVGRELDNKTLTLRAASFEAEFAPFWFDAAVIETVGIDEKNLWVARQNHAFLPALLARADSCIAVAKSTAVGRKGDRVAGPLTRADVIVIDQGASDADRKAIGEGGVDLRVAGTGEGAAFGLDKVGNIYVFKRVGGRFAGTGHAADLEEEPDEM